MPRCLRSSPTLWLLAITLAICASTKNPRLYAQAPSRAEAKQSTPSSDSAMHRHYDAAYRLQSSGDLAGADAEHKLFLAEALHHAANGRANIGRYEQAAPLYEEALRLAPNDLALRLDDAKAAFDAGENAKATALAQSVLDLRTTKADASDAKSMLILGKALWGVGDHKKALEELKAAEALNPDLDDMYALGQAYLALGNKADASSIFGNIVAKFGDTAFIRMKLGYAYATENYFPEAIEEFKRAIAKDNSFPEAHYSLGASYIGKSGEEGYAQAEPEFRKELALHPADTFSYPQLGRIALSRHDEKAAEFDLTRAIRLDPHSPETFTLLAQLYSETNRLPDAELALRHAIALTTDPSRNHYAIHTAHYQLGRLLIQTGNVSEGRQELQIAEQQLALNRSQDDVRLTGKGAPQLPPVKPRTALPAEIEEEQAFEKSAAPLMAGSYNNLGVHAAMQQQYEQAAAYFEQAAKWNPGLPGIDENWGRAAFAAGEYQQAVAPLRRSLQSHPGDKELRLDSGVSEYQVHDYSAALRTLQPIEPSLDSIPPVALEYADAMAKAGYVNQGMQRLQALEQTDPKDAAVHRVVAGWYAASGKYQQAAEEMHTAINLDPSSADTQFSSALDLIVLGQKTQSETVLAGLANAGSREPGVYYLLGKLQMEDGEAKSAITSLQTATQIDPGNCSIHQALAEAFQKTEQPPNADREAKSCPAP